MTKRAYRPKVSATITRNLDFLRQVYTNRRSAVATRSHIGRATDEQLLCFVEICLNILRGRLPLRKRHMRRLCALAHTIRRLARTRTAKSARRLLMCGAQQGRGIGVAGIVASVLVPLVVDMFMKNKQETTKTATTT